MDRICLCFWQRDGGREGGKEREGGLCLMKWSRRGDKCHTWAQKCASAFPGHLIPRVSYRLYVARWAIGTYEQLYSAAKRGLSWAEVWIWGRLSEKTIMLSQTRHLQVQSHAFHYPHSNKNNAHWWDAKGTRRCVSFLHMVKAKKLCSAGEPRDRNIWDENWCVNTWGDWGLETVWVLPVKQTEWGDLICPLTF